MLCLSRKVDERIVIGGNVVVTVNRVQGDKVTLGIDAPHDVTIHRQEVQIRIQREEGGDGSRRKAG